MPFTDDGYEPYTEDELYNSLRTRFEEQFDVTVTAGDLVDEILQAEASVLANYQEEMASRVYDAAFVELADGDELTMKARELGIIRKDAIAATGVAKFSRSTPTKTDRPIPEDTTVQTDEINPIEFTTTEPVTLNYIDGFEDGISDYVGDTGDANVVSVHPHTGNNELEIAAVSGSSIHREDINLKRGSLLHANVYHETGTVTKTRFGLQDANNCYQVVADAGNNIISLDKVEGGTVTQLDSISTTVPTGEYLHYPIDWKLNGDIEVSVEDSTGNLVGTVSVAEDDTYISGYVGFGSGDANGKKYWDEVSTQAVSANIQAVNGGAQTNVPAESITNITRGITGIEEVVNPHPTGNKDYDLTDGIHQTRGLNREEDDELRERVFSSLSGGGQATRGAIYTSVSNIDGVVSLSIFTNSEDQDNTGTGGLPPYSSEVVVYGGSIEDIVNQLYDTMSFVDFLRLHGGSHGIEESYDVYDEAVDDTFTGVISRPPRLSLDLTVDVVYREEEYAGKESVKDAIVDYIGGKDQQGSPVIGLGVGTDVYESEVRTAVNSVPGVLGITNLVIDSNGDGTDDTTTDSDGLSIIDVSKEEVAQVNLSDNAVVVNENKK